MNGRLIVYVKGGSSGVYSETKPTTGYGIHFVIGNLEGKFTSIRGKYLLTTQGYIPKQDIATPKHIKNRLKKMAAFPSDNNTTIDKIDLTSVTEVYGYGVAINEREAYLEGIEKALELIPTIVSSSELTIDDVTIVLDSVMVLSILKKAVLDKLDFDKINEYKTLINSIHNKVKVVSKHYNLNLSKVIPDSDDLGLTTVTTLSNMAIKKHSTSDKEKDYELISFDKSYWKDINIDFSMFYFKELFNFYPDETLDTSIYYGINYKELDEFGKKLSNVTYTLVKVPKEYEDESILLVNKLYKLMRDTLKTLYVPYTILLDNVRGKSFLRNYYHYGLDYLIIKKDKQTTIKTLDNITIATTLYPTGLSNIVMGNFLDLIVKYNEMIDTKDKLIDISDKIYDIDKKHSIKKDFINDNYIIKLPYRADENYRLITLRIKPKLDLPNRNTLRKLEKLSPKVYISLTKYQEVVVLRSLVRLENGVDILSDNFYANKTFLRKK